MTRTLRSRLLGIILSLSLPSACGGGGGPAEPQVDPLAPIITSLTTSATTLVQLSDDVATISADVVPSQACLDAQATDEALACDVRFGVLLVDGVEVGEFVLDNGRYKTTLDWDKASQGVSQQLASPDFRREFVAEFTDVNNRTVRQSVAIAPTCFVDDYVNCDGTCFQAKFDENHCGGCGNSCYALTEGGLAGAVGCGDGACLANISMYDAGQDCNAICASDTAAAGGAGTCVAGCGLDSSNSSDLLDVFAGTMAIAADYDGRYVNSNECDQHMAPTRIISGETKEFTQAECCCLYAP